METPSHVAEQRRQPEPRSRADLKWTIFRRRAVTADVRRTSNLDVAHVTITVNDARHFDSTFNRAEDDYVVADAK